MGIFVSFSLLTYLIVSRQTSILERETIDDSRQYIRAVASAIRNSMLQGVPTIAKNTVSELNMRGTVKAAVYDGKGSLSFGDGTVKMPEHLPGSVKETFLEQDGAIVAIKPLLNEPDCRTCHSFENEVLGAVAIRIPMDTLTGNISDTGKRLIIFGILLGTVGCAIVFIFMKKTILDPLMKIHQGINIIWGGDLSHRIALNKKDEFGKLADTFDQMTERLEKAHMNLENAVRQKTKELSVIAELSFESFKGGRPIESIVDKFLDAITEKMDFNCSSLCLIERESGLISQEFNKGLERGFCSYDIVLTSDHPFAEVVKSAQPSVSRSKDLNFPESLGTIVIIPVLSHQRKRCRDIIECPYEECPAYSSDDDRCWMIEKTLCYAPIALDGKDKLFGCLHCEVFPVLGVLVAGKKKEISKSSIHSLEIMSSVIASAIENYRFVEGNKKDVGDLVRLYDIAVDLLEGLDTHILAKTVIQAVASFSNINGSILWFTDEEGMLHLEASSGIEKSLIPEKISRDDLFIGESILEDRICENIRFNDAGRFSEVIKKYGFLYMAVVPLKFRKKIYGCLALFKERDFLMSESEKAIISLFASQSAAALQTARMYGELLRQKDLSDAVFHNVSSGLMVLDKSGRLLKLNRPGEEILRISESDTRGIKLTEIYPEARDMVSASEKHSGEIVIRAPDGTNVPLGFTNSLLIEPTIREGGIIVIFRDLTEIKRLQEELRKKQHFETVGKVMAGVAHEIRNPLFGISSIGQILEGEIKSEQHHSLIQAMMKEIYRMKNLIEEFLLYSRPSKLNFVEVDLAGLIDKMKHHIRAKKPEVVLDVSADPGVLVYADFDKVTQVFLNLVDNAIDGGCRMMEISVKTVDNAVRISVSDDGVGMKKEVLEDALEPFFTTKKEGLGLGLPICKKIIEDHGGTFDIQSVQGEGTKVTLMFFKRY
jgi:PAS domain S-box-containing protein